MDKLRKEVRITLRMPADIAEGVKQSAQENDRSFNGEIVRALREYLAKQTQQQRAK
jgi:hypothetical protein